MADQINVYIETKYGSYQAGVKIDDFVVNKFAPLNECTERYLMAFDPSAALEGSETVRVIKEIRKNTAEEIAQALTRIIMQAMKNNDTINGYRRSKS